MIKKLNEEEIKKLENYDKLLAKYTECQGNYEVLKELHKNLLKVKDKEILNLKEELKKANDELFELKYKQFSIYEANN